MAQEDKGRLSRVARKVRKEMTTKGYSGWSVKASGPDAGKVAKDAYMVSLHKDKVERPVSDSPNVPELRAYQAEFADQLGYPNAYHGGWLPGEGRQGVQDVSIRYPRSTPGSLHDAARAAILGEQEGIGIVNRKGGYAGTINMPRDLSLSYQQFPEEVRTERIGNRLKITPSASDMLETGAAWVVRNAPALMKDEARDPEWDNR